MKTKLTLSVDKDLAQFAHAQAQKNKRSVSGMFSEYLQAQKEQAEKTALPSVAEMVGTLKNYQIDDSKKAIARAYAKKYLRRP